MGRVTVLLLLVLGLSRVGLGQSVELNAVGSHVLPGAVGHLSLQWENLVSVTPVGISVDAPGHFNFMGLPSLGSTSQGSSALLFMVHPYTPSGAHHMVIELEGGDRPLAQCTVIVEVGKRYGIESSLLLEQRDRVEILHTNTGNVDIELGSKTLNPGASIRAKYYPEQAREIQVFAVSEDWDSSYTVPLKKRFYPASSVVAHSKNQPLMDYHWQQQWMGQRSFSNARVAFHEKNWHLHLYTWNRYIRGAGTYRNGQNFLAAGHRNFQGSHLIRPNISWYAQGAMNGWNGFIDEQSFGGSKRWSKGENELHLGGMGFGQTLVPHLALHLREGRDYLSYESIGKLQEAAWGLNRGSWNSYGRLLHVPKQWTQRSLQQSNGVIGNSLSVGTFRLNQQSAFYQNQGELFHFHNAQVQLGSKGFQWITRGMYSSNGMARASSQATCRLGRHSISLRNQRAIVKAGTQSQWLGQYYWRTPRSNFSLSAQHLISGWTFRTYGGWSFRSYSFHVQGGYSSLPSSPWFYQASLSKKVGNQQISVVSSRRIPVQIAIQGTLFHPSEWVNIKGRVVDGKGAGLTDVVLHYGDRIVQTDSKGSFEFTGVTRNCSLEIKAASMPFAHFPVEGYTQQFDLKAKHNRVEIRCFSSGGIRGDVRTKFSNAVGLRSPIHYDDLVIVLQNKGQKYTCEIDGTGAFRISGIPPGEYQIYIQGLSNDYRFSPASVSVEEGFITSLPLTIWEVEQTIPMQQL